MAIDPAHTALARRFAPILYFHKAEQFFPADAKRYLERCALWKAEFPFDDHDSWGGKGGPFPREPLIDYGKIAGIESEARPGDTSLGKGAGGAFPFLVTNSNEERFLELAGWAGGPPGPKVDSGTPNRFANLTGFTGVSEMYDLDPGLKSSLFWYHAEAFDTVRIRQIAATPGESGLEIMPILKDFKEPFLLCYYLFFPGHLEGIDGCLGQTELSDQFCNFGGDWACVALLLDRAMPTDPFKPRFVGLTSRNVGVSPFLDQERRVGMTVEDVGLFSTVQDHVRLFVASGTHGLYPTPGPRPIEPFTPDDPSWGSCGLDEGFADIIPAPKGPDAGIIIAKALIIVVGWIWATNEASVPFTSPPSPQVAQHDDPPAEGDYGVAVHPAEITLPDAAQAETTVPWSIPAAGDSATIDGRRYSFMVDRRETDPHKQQAWWPSDGTNPGYAGRWGPRVANDPHGRRAGMRFPDFASMFLLALAKTLSK